MAKGGKQTTGQLGQGCSMVEEPKEDHEAAESASAVAVQPAGEVSDMEDICPQPTSAQTRVGIQGSMRASGVTNVTFWPVAVLLTWQWTECLEVVVIGHYSM